MVKDICQWILYKHLGWKKDVTVGHPKKFIICLAPHTSNWDFLIGLLFSRAEGIKSNFLMKKEWFFWPLGPIFRKMGGVPVRIAKEVQDAYIPVMDEAIQYDWSDRKIRTEGTPVEKEPVLVQRFHIDTNHHMNNGKYILVAEEYLPENFKTESIRVEYKKAAVIGDMLYPEVYEQQNGVTIVLADAQKVPYAIIQFRGK